MRHEQGHGYSWTHNANVSSILYFDRCLGDELHIAALLLRSLSHRSSTWSTCIIVKFKSISFSLVCCKLCLWKPTTCAVFLPPRSDSMEVPNNSTCVHYFSLLTKLNIRTRDHRSGHAQQFFFVRLCGTFSYESLCLIPKWAMQFTHIVAITILNKPDRFYKSSWLSSQPLFFSLLLLS